MLKKNIVVLGLIFSILSTQVSPALANDCEDHTSRCLKTIEACDKAISAKNKALQLSDLALRKCAEKSGTLAVQNREKDDALAAWYRNPVVMVVIGVLTGIAGGLVIHRVTK